MSMTDPIADFLTRIRNAIHASHEIVVMPGSRQKAELARILAEQGYIDAFTVAPAAGSAPHLTPGTALICRREAHPARQRRHRHRDRVDLARRDDRP